MNLSVILTKDGSHTVSNEDLGENYHSTGGAIQESQHVFIDAGLKAIVGNRVSILEVGFGTGLNLLLSILYAEEVGKDIQYLAIEKYPLRKSCWSVLNYKSLLGSNANFYYEQIHLADWEVLNKVLPFLSLRKLEADMTEIDLKDKFDLVYFDAFSPEVQPELWSDEIFKKIYECMNPGGLLVTYSTKGSVKRTLRSVGFKVERLEGPPGKWEMLRASVSNNW